MPWESEHALPTTFELLPDEGFEI